MLAAINKVKEINIIYLVILLSFVMISFANDPFHKFYNFDYKKIRLYEEIQLYAKKADNSILLNEFTFFRLQQLRNLHL